VLTDAQAGAGVINANSSLISASRLRTGSYRVGFPASLSFCAVVVTLSGEGGFDAGAFESAQSSVNVGPSFFGGATHWESLDIQVRSYGGTNAIGGALADGFTLNIVVFC
jgi:hypothetical protein